MPSQYLSLDEFREESLMPAAHVDELERRFPRWLEKRLRKESNWLDSQLRPRYGAPFSEPYPEQVRTWLEIRVTYWAYHKLGINPTDAQIENIEKLYDAANAEVKEATDGENGRIDLPAAGGSDDGNGSAATKGGPLYSADASPYAPFDRQRAAGRADDLRWRGTGG